MGMVFRHTDSRRGECIGYISLYKENRTNIILSVKKLNRFTKEIKDKLSELEENDAITISETVDMINDELMGAELKKKVVRNGLKLLKIIQGELEFEEIYELISNYCEYVEEITTPNNSSSDLGI